MWAVPTDDEILAQIDHENMISLKMIKKTDRQSFKLYNCNLLLPENLKSCYRILRTCHDLKKVELQYCQIDDRTMGILLKVLVKLPDLLYLGTRLKTLMLFQDYDENRTKQCCTATQRRPPPQLFEKPYFKNVEIRMLPDAP